jgi:two-component system nitrogen regulation sensor histidine kinase NtrY
MRISAHYVFFLKLIGLLSSVIAVCYCYFNEQYTYLPLVVVALIWLLILVCKSHLSIYREISDFTESVRYHDFTRHFNTNSSSLDVKPLRLSFNEINKVLREMSIEKEIQYQYLNHLLDIVDTGILSYEKNTGKIMWMNAAFKHIFGIPYLHTLDGLKKKNPDLYAKTIAADMRRNSLVTLQSRTGPMKLLLRAGDFQHADGHFRMITYQNVNETIDKTESVAWQKLLRVLTHEIMNSIAPIASLAATMTNRLKTMEIQTGLEDVHVGLETIQRRSESLLKFASTYRSLDKISQLNLQTVFISELFENLYQLLEPTLIQKGIEMDLILKDTQLKYELDKSLMEQVLINLILNAIEAVKHSKIPYISLGGTLVNGKLQIRVVDHGKGISQDMLDNIFTPFFTTRKSGSGVGLTLSKQIMLLHGGTIVAESQEGIGSCFTLQF